MRTTIRYRSQKRAAQVPSGTQTGETRRRIADHPAFGMWADRADIANVAAYVRTLREGRCHTL